MTMHKNGLQVAALAATALVGVLGVLHVAQAAGTAHNIGTTGKVNVFGNPAATNAVVRGFAGLDVTAGSATIALPNGPINPDIRVHLFNSNGPQAALRVVGYDINQEKVPACTFTSTARGADRPLNGPFQSPACANVKYLSIKVFDGTNLPSVTSNVVEPQFLDQVPTHTSTFVGP